MALVPKPSCCPSPTREPSKPKPSVRDSRPPPQTLPKSSMAEIRRIVSAEAIVDAGAAVADAATAGAMAVIVEETGQEQGIEVRRELPTAPPSRATRARSSRRRPVRSNPAETSPRARLPDTSRFCCPESQFPSTSVSRSSRSRNSHRFGKHLPLSSLELTTSRLRLWPLHSRKMNRSLPPPSRWPSPFMRSMKTFGWFKKSTSSRWSRP